MGLALLAIIWLITLVSTYFFAAQTWWLPHGASTSTPWIDHQFALTYLLMGIVFVAAQGALGLFVWQYRDRGSATKVTYSHGNTRMEVIWTALTAILFIGLNLMGSPIWASERFAPADPGSVPVEVTGMQFAWYFRYPGADGKFGRTDPKLMDPSAGNEAAVGLDTTDPAAKDDVVTGTMYLTCESAGRSDLARGRRDPQLFCSTDAIQTGCGSRTNHPYALHTHRGWRVRDRLRRALRTRALQNARHVARC